MPGLDVNQGVSVPQLAPGLYHGTTFNNQQIRYGVGNTEEGTTHSISFGSSIPGQAEGDVTVINAKDLDGDGEITPDEVFGAQVNGQSHYFAPGNDCDDALQLRMFNLYEAAVENMDPDNLQLIFDGERQYDVQQSVES
ncbi:MAG: hypothetical protein SFZ03_00970 [Candidatus Melainabacteria bacterium]|nr:hypothetical protein [Candidatus Melainabacteria bacterium]